VPDGAPDSLRIKRFPLAGALGALSAKAPKELSGALPTELIRQSKLRSLRFRVRPSACRENCASLRCFSSQNRTRFAGLRFCSMEANGQTALSPTNRHEELRIASSYFDLFSAECTLKTEQRGRRGKANACKIHTIAAG
jgi:hypothetical protein